MIEEIIIKPIHLPFDAKAREACKSCKRYGFKATCPPHVDSVKHYADTLRGYSKARIYYSKTKIDNPENWEKIGKETSLEIHNKLIEVRDELYKLGYYFVSIFGAGSCKLCKECSFPCRQPQSAIVPLEATGVNVVELMKKHNVIIKFPVEEYIYRIGMVLYD